MSVLNRFWTAKSNRTTRVVVLCLSLIYTATAIFTGPAEANSRYAALVISAHNGKVLFSRNPDSRRYPASLTKVMTLYLLFEALEQGKVTLQTKMKASKRAAGQAPSKIGLKPGETITVEEAIRVLVVKSANDVATVVAEHVGGTEYNFAQLMTKKAWSLGMSRTRFQNASGLPNKKQYTTARDMGILAQRIMSDYPQYYKYFKVKSVTWKGRKYQTHNNLLKGFNGTDGIKTGYIRASGFNLISSVTRDGNHLIGVVFGGRSPKTRDAHMRQILTEQFARLKNDPILSRKIAFLPTPVPKPGEAGTQTLAAATPDTAPNRTATMEPIIEEGDTSYMGSLGTLDVTPSTSSLLPSSNDPIGDLIGSQQSAPQPVAGAPLATAKIGADTLQLGNGLVLSPLRNDPVNEARIRMRLEDSQAFYGVQIGAYGFKELAVQRLNAAAQKAPNLLRGVLYTVLPTSVDNRTVYRARIGPFREVEASNTCNALQEKGLTCITVVQERWHDKTQVQ